MTNLKVPPNAKDLEAMVIGLILQYPDCWSTVQSMLQPRDFYVAANASIFRLALDLDARGQAVDAVTVSELANAKGAEHLLSHLAECVESAFSPGNVAAYARIIRDHRVSRDMLAASHTLGQLAYGDDPVESRVIAAQAAALAIGDESATGEPVSIGKALSGVVEALESRRGVDPIGISTGFECLDARWRGINPGHLIVIAGRPAMGKTTLALNIAEHVARTRRVLFFSLEMGADELIEKTLSNRAGVFYSDIRDASFWDNREQYDRFTRALPDVGALDLSIDETGSIAMPQIRARARRHAHTNPVGLIVIDYLQLIAKERGVSTYDHVTECSRQAKLLAKELGCSVILLSQLNRKCDERPYGKNRPVMSDLRDSGSIEQDADIIAFTYRDVVYNENTNAPHIAECITAKQRRGIPGTDYLREEFNCSRFVDHFGAKPTYGPAVRAAAGFDA